LFYKNDNNNSNRKKKLILTVIKHILNVTLLFGNVLKN